MDAEAKQMFDFSLDALLFRKRLIKLLKEEKQNFGATELADDALELINAAGVQTPPPKEDEAPKELPPIPW
ncbi:MAG: hypothetical protein E7322_05470 [Clostridiales bacterium]|nr:hypothetical protein [Clostridiales bacterium]